MNPLRTLCMLLALTVSVICSNIQAQSGHFLHTVTKGQTLYSIAAMYGVQVADIVQLNPGCDTVIRDGQQLRIPQSAASVSGLQRYHTIQQGETLYQLTVKYGVTAQAICNANPGLSASNFRAGQVIAIPPSTGEAQEPAAAKQQAPEKKRGWRTQHRVEKKETIYSISNLYGISQAELIEANPELKTSKLKKGSILFIPYPKEQQAEQKQKAAPSNETLFNENRAAFRRIKNVKAALVLPFTKEDGASGEEEARMLEFYEGFLLAADSLKRMGVSMEIYTYDTKGSTARVNQLISQGKLKGMDVVFGPTNAVATRALAAAVKGTETRLIAPFSPKVDEVYGNPNVYQINTPQSYLYSEAYEHFIRKFRGNNIIFISDGSGTGEKTEFITGMKNELREKGIDYKQIQISEEVDGVNVIAAMDTLGNNIFIPTSGSNTALIRILPHLTLVRRDHPDFDLHLFGYPEWQTYTHEHLASFYELDTYFYSSFYTNNLFPAAILFTHNYRHWFNKDMTNSYPKYGMLGFDVGYFFLKGLAQQGSHLEENLDKVKATPIQTGFKFERVNNWGGFINRKVFFVHFSKDYELIKMDFE